MRIESFTQMTNDIILNLAMIALSSLHNDVIYHQGNVQGFEGYPNLMGLFLRCVTRVNQQSNSLWHDNAPNWM